MLPESKRTTHPSQLEHWAELVFPWLPPPDLAAAASTCDAFRRVTATITYRRSSDAARGLETHSIPFRNTVDSQPYSYFLYSPFSLICSSSTPLSQPWGGVGGGIPTSIPSSLTTDLSNPIVENASGCDCKVCFRKSEVDFEGCPCWSRKEEAFLGLGEELEIITECGKNCACGLECASRVTQRGVSVQLRIVKNREKGWGLHAAQFVGRGQFVCEYAGEFLTTKEARRRQKLYDELASSGRFSHALLVVREHLPSGKACLRVNIDATKVGNAARFINHSCDGGNLLSVLVRCSGSLLPRLCFFASANIEEGEELTFSYGDVRLRPGGLPCFCGTSVCSGILPSEET
ncbi:histone-lysine N-methyltransferase SUVR3 [Typha latifolia]|uniref:histone-lysine N-methyltransferase SUVR3 n=1 Tax=Typha latifolia TaxID=4733 RepID=UPI003C2B975E